MIIHGAFTAMIIQEWRGAHVQNIVRLVALVAVHQMAPLYWGRALADLDRELDWRPGGPGFAVGPPYLVSMPGEVKYPTMQSALEMCNFSWTPSLLEKDNSKNNPYPVSVTVTQWRSQRGHGAMPPQTFGECFFLQLIYVVMFF